MRRRIYVDGKPAWSENEPDCAARRQGHGGAAMGSFQGVLLTARQQRDLAPRKRLRRAALGRKAT